MSIPIRRPPERAAAAEANARPLASSCTTCRARKVKCDGAKPCSHCVKNGSDCVYMIKRKPGLRPGTGQELERRVQQIEQQLLEHAELLKRLQGSSVAQPSVLRVGPLDSSPSDTGSSSALPVDRSPYASFPSANLQLSPTKEPQPLPPINTTAATPALSSSPLFPPSMLPPDLVYSLIDLYFRYINPTNPILLRSFIDLTAVHNSSLPSSIIVHAIIAVTLRFSSDPRLTPQSRASFHTAAKQSVILQAIESTTFEALQALSILSIDVIGDGRGPSSWGVLALLTRSMQHLGLTVETGQTVRGIDSPVLPSLRVGTASTILLAPPRDWKEEEARRRLTWAVFLLDRHASVSTGWSFALDKQEFVRRLPCREDLWDSEEHVFARFFDTSSPAQPPHTKPPPVRRVDDDASTLGAFSFLVEITDILGRVHAFLRTPVDILTTPDVVEWLAHYRSLEDICQSWWSSLPDWMCDTGTLEEANGDFDDLRLIVHVMYQSTQIRLHSSAAFPPLTSSLFFAVDGAAERCVAAARTIVGLSRPIIESDRMSSVTSTLGWSNWVAGRVLFTHSYLKRYPMFLELQTIVQHLRAISTYWDSAGRYAEILTHALQSYEADQSARQLDANAAPSPAVQTLTDMGRTAYGVEMAMQSGSSGGSDTNGSISALVPAPAPSMQGLLNDMSAGVGGGMPAGVGGALGMDFDPSRRDLTDGWVHGLYSWFDIPMLPFSAPQSPK